ncbi:MAG: T9SS type A sorting domain-containing protein [Ignavibacteriae bacterium]|nr:T9SS type A sorting domain-containing protein [Ignavibacteriota bacterium]
MDTRHRLFATALVAGLVCVVGLGMPQGALAQCGELITNGDFEAGNSGFASQYVYLPGNLYPEGVFDVAVNHNLSHACFGGTDHTSGTGKSMAVNGSVTAGKIVWSQTVLVLPGTNYALSAWVTSHCGAFSRAVLRFTVNGVQVGGNHWAPATAFEWNNFSATWNSGAATSAVIEIIDLNTAPGGNDFGLDDISFMKIDETEPVITPAPAATMWPPNHTYHTFTLAQLLSSVTDDCDTNPEVVITSVSSDEPEDAQGGGDGNTVDDIVIAADCQSVDLRAERKGNGNGRVYTIHILAKDYSNNWTQATCTVTVPHNMNSTPVDDGAAAGYTEYGPCALGKASAGDVSTAGFDLEPNYPNPFNPSTTLSYTLPVDASVTLRVYDYAGNVMATVVDGFHTAGNHRVSFNASDLPSGMYLYRLEADGVVLQRAMQLVK